MTAKAIPFDLEVTGFTPDHVMRHVYCRGCFEPALTQFVMAYVALGAGDVAVDAGANIGWYSLLLARLADADADARVIAFEPDPENFDLLKRNVVANGAEPVVPVNAALGDRSGTLTLYHGPERNRGRHSLLPLNEGRKVPVPVLRLDDYWRRNLTGHRLRFLKIDVEGYEAFVLRGAGGLLNDCRLMLLEYSPEFLARVGIPNSEVLDPPLAAGLSPFAWERNALEPVSIDRLRDSSAQWNLIWCRVV